MKYLLLGAGLRGTSIAHDLLYHAEGTTRLHIFDADTETPDELAARLDDPRVTTTAGDIRDNDTVGPLMADADVTLSTVNYWFNADLAALAVANRCHFLDLGGNKDIVARELELHEEAKEAGVTIVPACGLAPGLAGILGYWLADQLDEVTTVRLRVGGLPADPLPPMNYKVAFPVQELINQYIEPAVVIRGGKLQTVPSLTELEPVTFPEPYGELEAFLTGGGTSTLPQSLLGRVPDLDSKTIRYRGHCAQVRLLHELGLTGSTPVEIDGARIAPRKVLAHCMDRALALPGDDVVLVLCWAEGWRDGKATRHSVRIVDRHDRNTDLSAMMRMTGFPTAIIATMLASGEINAPGARRQELIVPGDRMLAELRRRNVAVEDWESEPGAPA